MNTSGLFGAGLQENKNKHSNTLKPVYLIKIDGTAVWVILIASPPPIPYIVPHDADITTPNEDLISI